jgi:drug/metabolite transporter (DMT)-like permease
LIEKEEKPSSTSTLRILAIVAINIYALVTTGVGASWKAAEENGVQLMEFSMFRSGMLFILIQPIIHCVTKKHPLNDLPRHLILLMCTRSFFGILAVIVMSYTITLLPLSVYFVLFNLAPFWTSFLGYLINGEGIYAVEIGAMVLCIACVIGISLGKSEEVGDKPQEYNMFFGVIMGVISSWVFAITFTLNRRIKDIHFSVILFWHAVIGFTGSLAIVLILWMINGNPPFHYTSQGWLWLNCASFFDFLAVAS